MTLVYPSSSISPQPIERSSAARSRNHIGMSIGIEIARPQKIRRLREIEHPCFRPKRRPCEWLFIWPKETLVTPMNAQKTAGRSHISADEIRHTILIEIRCRQGRGSNESRPRHLQPAGGAHVDRRQLHPLPRYDPGIPLIARSPTERRWLRRRLRIRPHSRHRPDSPYQRDKHDDRHPAHRLPPTRKSPVEGPWLSLGSPPHLGDSFRYLRSPSGSLHRSHDDSAS
jgi:hypothetical protein